MRLDRLNAMEQYVIEHGTASLEELATVFHISTNTVRRDLIDLIERGTITKVYGGVTANGSVKPEPFAARAERLAHEKQLIGRLTADLVEDGMSIFLDSGSTTACLLPYLADKQNVTVITHSLTALYEAAKYPSLRVIALGGLYNGSTASFVGASTLEALSHMAIDLVCIAATGVSLEGGLSNTTFFEVEVKRAVTRRSERVVLMADHSKFDHNALLSFCRFEDLYAVATDRKPDARYQNVIEQNGIRLLCP